MLTPSPRQEVLEVCFVASGHDYVAVSIYPRASSAALYAREGLTAMNGRSDTRELTTVADFRVLASYAVRHGLGRLTYWAVNRDRPCPRRTAPDCSGTAAPAWAFTRALVAAQ